MSDMLTVFDYAYSTVDTRCLDHPGCIVDLGCLGWDWCRPFIGRKRVIGADPFEDLIEGVELFKGVVGPFTGTVEMAYGADASTSFPAIRTSCSDRLTAQRPVVAALSWQLFCEQYKIDAISVLKVNIEGGEYPLLASMRSSDFDKIDQIAISFHDWMMPEWQVNTAAMLALLSSHRFRIRVLAPNVGWYLAMKEYP